jgi:hypothetical protein
MISFQCHWCIQLLPPSLIHPFHSFLSESPSKISPMKQGTNKTVAVREAPRRRKVYIKCGVAWFGKGRTMVLRFIFKILVLITIFLMSNKKLNRQTLIHCSTFVICARVCTLFPPPHTHTHTQNTTAVAASIIPKKHVDKVAKFTTQTGIA